jgi:hypothetical protein
MDERMRLAAVTHVSHLNASIALWRDDAGCSARIDHADGWPDRPADRHRRPDPLPARRPDAHEAWGRQLIDTPNHEESSP